MENIKYSYSLNFDWYSSLDENRFDSNFPHISSSHELDKYNPYISDGIDDPNPKAFPSNNERFILGNISEPFIFDIALEDSKDEYANFKS